MARPKKEEAASATDVTESNAVLVPVEVQRVGPDKREEFKKILTSLSERLPDELIKTRTQKTKSGREFTLDYLEWFVVADELDKKAGNWSSSITSLDIVEDNLVVRVAITIDGVTRENVGIEPLATGSSNYGDVASNAFAMAFKRTAALFGVGRFLYHKDIPEAGEEPESRSEAKPTPAKATPAKAATSKRSDGKLEARLVGMQKVNDYSYMAVEVPSLKLKWPIKQFFSKEFDHSDLMAAVNAPANITYPFECLVSDVSKNSKGYYEIGAYYPVDQEQDDPPF